MSELKTVEHKGKVYQIGAAYEFSDCGKWWHCDYFEAVRDGAEHEFASSNDSYVLCREIQSVGTIAKVEVKLIDGAAYQFDCKFESLLGFYYAECSLFVIPGNSWALKDCTNIIPLVPVS